jgi:hypothetical protein
MEWMNNKLFSDILRGRFFMKENSIDLLIDISLAKSGVMKPTQFIAMRPILPFP